MKHVLLLLTALLCYGLYAQIPCENGVADGYPCNQISLYAVVSPDELMSTEHDGYWANDIWGWTDPETGHEYALVGLTDGIAIVDVTTPTDPVVIGKLEEAPGADNGRIQHGKSTWRDMKVFQNYLFVVSDRNDVHGMQVFDLTHLRAYDGTTPQHFAHDAQYTGIYSVHNIAINEETGFAYIVGTYSGENCIGGGLHIVDINDPLHPEFVACFDEDGYTHDAQCVVYRGPDSRYQESEICFNSNEDTFTIVDVEDKESMTMISRTPYDRAEYSHQGWLSEDQRFFLMNDELDEMEYGFNPRTLIWNIEDLENPQLIGEYYNEAKAIDHNLYTHDGLVYESNYLSGLRVMDLARLEEGKMREVAFFDTYPEADDIHFGGTWSNYPYFESGTIIVSDMYRGLFVLKLDRKQEAILSHPSDVQICAGTDFHFTVETDGLNLSYQWQRFNGRQFVNLNEDASISGTTTTELTIEAGSNLVNVPLRCKVVDNDAAIFYSFPAEAHQTELPVAGFSYELEQVLSSETESRVAFTNSSQHAVAYLWDFGDENTSTEENPEHEFAVQETYQVQLTAMNDCGSDTVLEEVALVTGADDPVSSFGIHPNPAVNFAIIHSLQSGILEVRDMTGKLIHRQSIHSGANQMDLNTLKPGVYLLTNYAQGVNETKRLVVN